MLAFTEMGGVDLPAETAEEARAARLAMSSAAEWFDETLSSPAGEKSLFRRAAEDAVAISYAIIKLDGTESGKRRRTRSSRRAGRKSAATAKLPRLVLITGWSETWLKYKEVVRDLVCGPPDGSFEPLALEGVYMMDHASQGMSGRYIDDPQMGCVPDFDTYTRDIAYFVRHVVYSGWSLDDPERPPLYLMAHSMGGLAAARYAIQNPGIVDRLLLSAPMLMMRLPAPMPLVYGLASFMCSIGKAYAYLPPKGPGKGPEVDPIPQNRCSMSKVRLDNWVSLRTDKKHLIMSGQSFAWLQSAIDSRLDASTFTEEDAAALRHTRGGILIMTCEHDELVDDAAHDHVARSTGEAVCRRVIVRGSKHEFMFERQPIRDEGMKMLRDFFARPQTEVERNARVVGECTASKMTRRKSNFAAKVAYASLSCPFIVIGALAVMGAIVLRSFFGEDVWSEEKI